MIDLYSQYNFYNALITNKFSIIFSNAFKPKAVNLCHLVTINKYSNPVANMATLLICTHQDLLHMPHPLF